MGKDDKKEDSGFGFKDKAKALETIELLKSHEQSYQRLTVRGLLGRAKRVLTLTKAEDKLKNIKEAMEVFEKWIEDYEKENPSKAKAAKEKKAESPKKSDEEAMEEGEDHEDNDKKSDKAKEDKSSDTVQGLGFKDKEKALETIKLLEGRDPDYQKLAVKGLVGRAKRVLTCTKDKDKIQNIKDAMEVFDKFLDDFDKMNLGKQNMSYLPLSVIENCEVLIQAAGLSSDGHKSFIKAYKAAGGDYKKLRTVVDDHTKKSWDVVRNKELKSIRKRVDEDKLFDDKGNPTRDHLKMIVWAYSPEDHKMKKFKAKVNEGDEEDKKKRKHSTEDKESTSEEESPNKKKK